MKIELEVDVREDRTDGLGYGMVATPYDALAGVQEALGGLMADGQSLMRLGFAVRSVTSPDAPPKGPVKPHVPIHPDPRISGSGAPDPVAVTPAGPSNKPSGGPV